MVAPAGPPVLGNVMQMAWVTPDLDRSLEQFKAIYRVPEFLVMDQVFAAEAFGRSGEMSLRMALANIDHMQIELIECRTDGIGSIYREVLPKDGSHANVFHHVCVKFRGSLSEWEAHVAGLGPDQPAVYTGDIGPGARFLYTDHRATIGLYVEHVWFSPETEAWLADAIPTYRTL